jgi:hypothetical protein
MTRWVWPLVVLIGSLAVGQQAKTEPDFMKISGNSVECPFFNFHYQVPTGWTTEDNALRMHKTTTQVFWLYELLVASPEPLPTEGKRALPYVRIWAMERFNMLDKPGDHARLLMQFQQVKMVHEPKEEDIAGHKFVRSDYLSSPGEYVSVFDTSAGKYLLFFEFRAKTEQAMNALAKTMETVKFD